MALSSRRSSATVSSSNVVSSVFVEVVRARVLMYQTARLEAVGVLYWVGGFIGVNGFTLSCVQ